ncbi:Uncharacterised protein [uncultured Bacteroides sp.]|nr:Uncharacterised protein [uncultured Bacteroides sp.]
MKKVYDRINVDLYIIAVAFGKNYSNNVFMVYNAYGQ